MAAPKRKPKGDIKPRKCKTPTSIASYPMLFSARQNDQGKDQFSICLLIPKIAKIASMRGAINAAIAQAYGKVEANWPKLRKPIRDGDKLFEEDKKRKEYRGHWVVNANTTRKPQVVHASDVNTPITDPNEVYAGCKVVVSLVADTYDYMGKKGVKFYLQNVCKVGEGKRLAGGPDASEEFADIEPEEDDSENAENYQEPEESSDSDDYDV